jgi:hypothetical protein
MLPTTLNMKETISKKSKIEISLAMQIKKPLVTEAFLWVICRNAKLYNPCHVQYCVSPMQHRL